MDSYTEALEALGLRARRLRVLRELQQRELAQRAGVTTGTVQRFERTGRASTESALRIAVALGCEAGIEQLFAQPQYRTLDEALSRDQVMERQRVRRPK